MHSKITIHTFPYGFARIEKRNGSTCRGIVTLTLEESKRVDLPVPRKEVPSINVESIWEVTSDQ